MFRPLMLLHSPSLIPVCYLELLHTIKRVFVIVGCNKLVFQVPVYFNFKELTRFTFIGDYSRFLDLFIDFQYPGVDAAKFCRGSYSQGQMNGWKRLTG